MSQESQEFSGQKEAPQSERTLTFGEKAVGVTFNPGGHPGVNSIKEKCAALIDELHEFRNNSTSPDAKRCASEAITQIQTGQMWGVKAVTWQE